ncbi:DUF6445 family protein [Lacimicrobium alkaliphilum]|uniref:Uncharacterized protein n=1 Tax=Lacimicrobium alkaliphilum TaxID=1526571 RepID=A0ABQ1RA93_9ALTE|nr:DUF6445 family protein [Lacimicrobium alkaliphilum]GGD62964.1 hypothetical protein GCM10011357_17810 [Lacimicrobium alkaliphilum]
MPDLSEQNDITFNQGAKVTILTPGLERTPVIVLDDVIHDLHPLRSNAYKMPFSAPEKAAYPGIRAPLPSVYTQKLLQAIYTLITDIYQIPGHLKMYPLNMYYSLVTTPPDKLTRLQRVPHFDNLSPYYFAIMHYLAPEPHGGTAFFRHRPTGFENITAPRFDQFRKNAEAHMASHGEPEARYQLETDSHFERIDSVEYCQNRLMIYPGTLLHSGLIDSNTDINPDPETGRLTANLFIEFK